MKGFLTKSGNQLIHIKEPPITECARKRLTDGLARPDVRHRLLLNFEQFRSLSNICHTVLHLGTDVLPLADFSSIFKHTPPGLNLAAVPAIGNKNRINAGVMLFHPSKQLYSSIYTFFNKTCGEATCSKDCCFPMADQGIIDGFYSSCPTSKFCLQPMPLKYNNRRVRDASRQANLTIPFLFTHLGQIPNFTLISRQM